MQHETDSQAYIYEHVINVLRCYYNNNNKILITDYVTKHHISYNEFLKSFENIVSLSPKQMEMIVLVYRAKTAILEHPDLSLGQIVNNLGLDNYSYFSRMFKSKLNIRPQKMKQNLTQLK